MALILHCDNCGHEVRLDRIVGREFDYLQHGFGSLSVVINGKRDLCKDCLAAAQEAFDSARSKQEREMNTAAWDAVRAAS